MPAAWKRRLKLWVKRDAHGVRRQSDGEEFSRVERSSKMPGRRGKKIFARGDGGEATAIATAGLERVWFSSLQSLMRSTKEV
jgi:hypothetical protein